MITFIKLLLSLYATHLICDLTLQSDTMAKGKNRNRKPDYIPEGQKYVPTWYFWLSAHSATHAVGVFLITSNYLASLFMFFSHWIIDFLKCENKTTPLGDQLLHLSVIIAMTINLYT